jgi:hypothetical protein
VTNGRLEKLTYSWKAFDDLATFTEKMLLYRFIEECSLFGCNIGFIPRLLKRQIPHGQDEPFKWHLRVEDAMMGAMRVGKSCSRSTLIIDLKPKQKRTNLSLYEVLDVWGYSSSGWTPILLHLRGLFVDIDPGTVNRNEFKIRDGDSDEPIYEFMYLEGTVQKGELNGRWTAPPASPTNAALLWPDALRFFFNCIRERTPNVLESSPQNNPMG